MKVVSSLSSSVLLSRVSVQSVVCSVYSNPLLCTAQPAVATHMATHRQVVTGAQFILDIVRQVVS